MTNRKKPDPDALEDIRRIVYRHKWSSLEDWARSMDDLAMQDTADADEEPLTPEDLDNFFFEDWRSDK